MKYYIGRSSFSFLHFMQIFPGFQPQGMLTMWDGISIPPAFTYFLVLGGGGGEGATGNLRVFLWPAPPVSSGRREIITVSNYLLALIVEAFILFSGQFISNYDCRENLK